MPTYVETSAGDCCCGGGGGQPCCDRTISNTLYMTIASDCAKLDGLVITLTYDTGDSRWEGYEPPSATWCEVLVTASCQGDGKIHVVGIFVNSHPLNLTEIESECDPLSVVTEGVQNVPEENSCCPGATFTGTITE